VNDEDGYEEEEDCEEEDEEFVVADKDLLNASLEFDFPLCALVVHSSPQRGSAY